MAPQQVVSSARGGLDYSHVADRQMPPPAPSPTPKSVPARGVGASGGPPSPTLPQIARMDAYGPSRRQPTYLQHNTHVQYSPQPINSDYRTRHQEIYEPLRRDVLHYIFEQTSNVHLHNEECTAALMQCLTQMLNALEVAIHRTEGRVIENMTYSAELQHDIGKCLSKLEGVTGYCRDTETHLVENLAETKASARSVQQHFEQDGNKLESIQMHLMQLTRQVQDAPTYNDMKAHSDEIIAAISSRFATLNSTFQKLSQDVCDAKAQNVALTSALSKVSERLSWLERADRDRLRRSSATNTAPQIRVSGSSSNSEVDLLSSSNDLSYGSAELRGGTKYGRLMESKDAHQEGTLEDNLVSPVLLDMNPQRAPEGRLQGESLVTPSPRGVADGAGGEQELATTGELAEATVAPLTLVPIDADDRSHFEVVTMNAEYTTPLLGAAEYRTEAASCSANAANDGLVEEKEDELPIAPPDQAASSQADVVQSRQDNIVEHVELPIAAFSSVDDGPAREAADELAKAMTSEGLMAESDAQGLLWNAGDRARAVGAGFCDGGLAQLVALAAPESEHLRIDIVKLHVEGLQGQPELTRDFGDVFDFIM